MADLKYSIKDLENFTQIKAHTIRIWEQRYNLLKPKRTKTNIRYYDQSDLKKILNINLLYNSGLKISKIAELSEYEILEKAKSEILVVDKEKLSDIDALVVFILDFNGAEIHNKLKKNLEINGMEVLYKSLLLPLLDKIGQLWQVNTFNIIHEHYFSSIFRELIYAEINQITEVADESKIALLFLHENEEHEFISLIVHYILKKKGYICHNFGQKVPIDEVLTAYKQIHPTIVFTAFTNRISEKRFEQITNVLVHMSETSKVLVTGAQLMHLDSLIAKELIQLKQISDLNSII